MTNERSKIKNQLERLIAALGDDLDLTGEDIADILWLALKRLESTETPVPPKTAEIPEKVTHLPAERSDTPPVSPPISSPPLAEIYPEPESPNRQTESPNRQTKSPNRRTGLGTGALALRVPDAPSLRESLKLAGALRPLMRRILSDRKTVLDEIETVNRIAREGICIPVLKAEPEPWLDLALVVDESKSMVIWRHTIQQLKQLLENYGIFRDVRTWGLVTDEQQQLVGIRPGIGTTARNQPIASFRELIDPSDRRLILIVSDCVSAMWHNGSTLSALKIWAETGPMALVQMLPERLWHRTALGLGSPVRISSLTPGAANQQLLVKERLLWDEIPLDTGIKVPVLTLEPEVALIWSQMVSGRSDAITSGVVFPLELKADNEDETEPSASVPEEESHERVYHFRMTASPMARKLAGLLAAAPAINLPVVRLIQETMLPQSRQVHVAEVFLGGLLKPLTPVETDTNPDAVQYDFMDDEIRGILLESAPVSDSADVLDAVSKYVAGQLGKSLQEFVALLKAPGQADEPEVKPFASVATQVLKRLGGDYARFAEQLEQGQQVAELAQSLKLDVARVALFAFEVVTVNARGEEVNRETKQAHYFTENLGKNVTLEMVAIPGGTFTMGAPETEKGSSYSERPQHDVTVQPFFLGKYPVTQAQWRAVARLPKVNRTLKRDPSHFKGDDRPVEQVSWYDAQEFCARLSQKTGRDYRLPSEAEWEYACRAGTNTPFHFGATITTDLANYDVSTYAQERKGQSVGETTPVGSFKVANAFGLYDMHGNVWEWCADQWHQNYDGAPDNGSVWYNNDNKYHMQLRLLPLRGGSWNSFHTICRSACRYRYDADYWVNYFGFRVACAAARTQ